ncbi:26s proteasome regulatory subunit 6B [Nowakowskiella sp. JEL0407]|nr:26s proteasome regulatory subunit 6B [Nowakowskiella sp. JEL0407]
MFGYFGLICGEQDICEAVELPLTHFDFLYGPPGTGKTMMVKVVAHHTMNVFIRVIGKRELAESSPAVICIDFDAIATKRFDAQTGADREVQRILLEILNQMDGFDWTSNVKVIMATKRADILDPVLLRPGRLDRKIEFPTPDRRQKRLIFTTITSKMNLSEEFSRPDKLSGAEIAAICQEAGIHAVRKNRYVILNKEIEKGYKSNVKKSEYEFEFYK